MTEQLSLSGELVREGLIYFQGALIYRALIQQLKLAWEPPWESLYWIMTKVRGSMDFPDVASGKESACQCRRCKRYGFDP